MAIDIRELDIIRGVTVGILLATNATLRTQDLINVSLWTEAASRLWLTAIEHSHSFLHHLYLSTTVFSLKEKRRAKRGSGIAVVEHIRGHWQSKGVSCQFYDSSMTRCELYMICYGTGWERYHDISKSAMVSTL